MTVGLDLITSLRRADFSLHEFKDLLHATSEGFCTLVLGSAAGGKRFKTNTGVEPIIGKERTDTRSLGGGCIDSEFGKGMSWCRPSCSVLFALFALFVPFVLLFRLCLRACPILGNTLFRFGLGLLEPLVHSRLLLLRGSDS